MTGGGDALGIAVTWSTLLFGTLAVFWRFDTSLPLDRSQLVELFAYHLLYGLGSWIRMNWIT